MIVAHGNHEINSVNFFSQFAMPGDEQNFTVEFGPVHLTVANDTPVNTGDLTGTLATTLGKNLAAGMSAKWNLLLHHKGLFSSAPAHLTDSMIMRQAWQSIIDANKVDVDFNGHDHDYERSFPMRGDTVGATPADGTIYVVVGSAGAELYTSGTSASTAFSESTYSFALVTIGQSMFQMNAYRGDGSMLDSLMIAK
jgi:acid phosphatase type 7